MLGAANVGADAFDLLLDHSRYDYDLFAPPNPSLSTVDHAIGLHASSLVRDGGTLQIGIGELGDSIVYSLLLRHQQNDAWRRALHDAGTRTQRGAHRSRRRPRALHHRAVRRHRDVRRPDARPVPRRHPAAARLRLSTAAARAGRERLEHARRRSTARGLLAAGAGPVLGAPDVAALKAAGVLRSETRFDDGHIVSPDGARIDANLGNAEVARGAGARMPGTQSAGRHRDARRIPAGPARLLCGAA